MTMYNFPEYFKTCLLILKIAWSCQNRYAYCILLHINQPPQYINRHRFYISTMSSSSSGQRRRAREGFPSSPRLLEHRRHKQKQQQIQPEEKEENDDENGAEIDSTDLGIEREHDEPNADDDFIAISGESEDNSGATSATYANFSGSRFP